MTQELLKTESLEINAQFKHAFDLLETTNASVFITGQAGTGKSTFLKYFVKTTRKNVIVLAPTGVAALNVNGQTIHSFFGFRPDTTIDNVEEIRLSKNKRQLMENMHTLVIDEISMVRADLLDCIDRMLKLHGGARHKPFGGVQMVFIGDLYQLPPVVRANEENIFKTIYPSPYFFDAKVFKELTIDFIEFDQHYRQEDPAFLELLNAIRNNSTSQQAMDILNRQFSSGIKENPNEFYIALTTTNDLADRINYDKLHAISEELYTFPGEISGQFDQKNLPTNETLEVKVGAQIMLLNNDPEKRWVNGSIGKIISIDEAPGMETMIRVELTTGSRVDVAPFAWEIYNFFYNEEAGSLESEVVGAFRQYPLRLAWAVTIHKSQGKTFDRVIIDLGRGTFSHGQTYVALSRCRSLEGIILKRPVQKRDILMDKRIPEFMVNYQYQMAGRQWPDDKKQALIKQAIEQRSLLEILYLKETGEKNRRTIVPKDLRLVDYLGQKCWGVEGFCQERKEDRIFRLSCIVDIRNSKEG